MHGIVHEHGHATGLVNTVTFYIHCCIIRHALRSSHLSLFYIVFISPLPSTRVMGTQAHSHSFIDRSRVLLIASRHVSLCRGFSSFFVPFFPSVPRCPLYFVSFFPRQFSFSVSRWWTCWDQRESVQYLSCKLMFHLSLFVPPLLIHNTNESAPTLLLQAI